MMDIGDGFLALHYSQICEGWWRDDTMCGALLGNFVSTPWSAIDDTISAYHTITNH